MAWWWKWSIAAVLEMTYGTTTDEWLVQLDPAPRGDGNWSMMVVTRPTGDLTLYNHTLQSLLSGPGGCATRVRTFFSSSCLCYSNVSDCIWDLKCITSLSACATSDRPLATCKRFTNTLTGPGLSWEPKILILFLFSTGIMDIGEFEKEKLTVWRCRLRLNA